MRLTRLKQTGDTIVEVLFAITILSVVIASAYVISNRAITANRLNNERDQALKYAEIQLETVKSKASTSANKAAFTTYRNTFAPSATANCILSSGVTATGNACTVGLYKITLTYNQPASGETDGYFVSKIVWDDSIASKAKSLELLYRVYNEK